MAVVYKIIKGLVKIFYPKVKLCGVENIPDEPVVFVGNHTKTNGPIVAELYMPVESYTWCIGSMMEKDEIQPYSYEDFWSKKPVYIRWFFYLLSYVIVYPAYCLFNGARTIPVYKDKRVIKTFNISVEKLMDGKSIVIFPEHYEKHNNIVYDFQRGFVDVARLYYKKTGKCLSFVPMYVAPMLKTTSFGKPIKYNPEAKITDERERICNELMDSITDIAVALPRHKVVQYPNIKKKYYPYNEV